MARSKRVPTSHGEYAVARVHLWDREVGAVAEDRRGRIVFEYSDDFRGSGLEISPIHLPLRRRGPVTFPELQRVASFEGLPGVLADALPDAFGNAVIRRWFEQRGAPGGALSPVQKLLYIGGRAMGALEFSPPLDAQDAPGGDEALEVARLVEEARRVVEGDAEVELPEMMQIGASAGGARAKALILWNPSSHRVRSAFATREPGDEDWLIKFDGVSAGGGGHEVEQRFQPGPFGRIEFVYSQMARAAGIDVPETELLRERKYAHFLIRRFDRVGGGKLHMHSLGGLRHADYNVRQVLSYEDYFRTIRLLGMGQAEVNQAYRRMVFNIMARNQDDHVMNLSFLMDRSGTWSLTPAYDVTWAMDGRWAMTHQMTAAGCDDGFTRADLEAVGAAFDVPRNGAAIIDEVESSLGIWEPEAESAGLNATWIRRVRESFRTPV